MARLGRLERTNPREAWPSESQGFTPWLAENLDLLSEALGVGDTEVVGPEVPVGGFRLDILALESGQAGCHPRVTNANRARRISEATPSRRDPASARQTGPPKQRAYYLM